MVVSPFPRIYLERFYRMTKTKKNAGHFKKGADPRRHKFTREQCQAGFWAAIYSIITRYPEAIDASGRHMACDFLRNRKGAE